MTDSPDTEGQLRDAFEAFAAGVTPAPDAYRHALNAWRRCERRRRLTLAIVIAVVFSLSVLIGLWVLNRAAPTSHVVFNGTISGQHGDHRNPAITKSSDTPRAWPVISP